MATETCTIVRAFFRALGKPTSAWAGFVMFADAGNMDLLGFYSDERDAWIITPRNGSAPQFLLDGSRLYPKETLYNATRVWGDNVLFYSEAQGHWVLRHSGNGEPHAWQHLDGSWEGDGWYECYLSRNADYEGAVQVRLDPKGNPDQLPQTPPTLSWSWPRWEYDASESGDSEAPYGIYKAQDGAAPAVIELGQAAYNVTGDGENWGLLVKEFGGDGWLWSRGGRLAPPPRTGESYILTGRENEEWLSLLPPSRGEPITLNPARAGLPSLTATFAGFRSSGRKAPIRMGEVAQWRN